MSLPVSRNRTYSLVSQLASSDLNDIQDQIIAQHLTTPHAARTLLLPASAGVVGTAQIASASLGSFVWTYSAGAIDVIVPLPLLVGDRILGLTAWLYEATAAPLTMVLMKYQRVLGGSAGTSNIIQTTASPGASSLGIALSGAALTETCATLYGYAARIRSGASGDQFAGLELTYDRP